jgi:serine/threonine protein kinase
MLHQPPVPPWANDESLGFLPKMAVQFSKENLGKGTHGVVYKGRLQTATGIQDVAIKQLAPGATERETRQFVKEFKVALKASQHCQGAAKLYGCVLNEENALCLVMKLYSCSLNRYLEERRDPVDDSKRQVLAPAKVADFACQMATILAALHASKIIVQDLKPSNVLLDENENLVIADYGLAVIMESSIMSSTASTVGGVGTPEYMAPEQHDSSVFGKVSDKTDVWALGCIVLEMLTGRTPWAGKRSTEILMNVAMKQQAPAIPSGLPELLDTMLRRCLVHNQAERASTREVIELLQPLLGGAVVSL